jgi:hypothetical protein
MTNLPALNTEWLLGRVTLAQELSDQRLGGTYPDGILVLSSVVSGIAAHLWPGDRIDRARFVELWVRYSEPALHPNHVSVLLLAQELANRGDVAGSTAVRALSPAIDVPAGWMDQRTFSGSEIDLPEKEILCRVPSLPRQLVRDHTYGNIFYRCFRSGYVHRYSDDPVVDQNPMSQVTGDVIYTSFAEAPFRRVYFRPAWLASIARSIIASAETTFQNRPLPMPSKWWVHEWTPNSTLEPTPTRAT